MANISSINKIYQNPTKNMKYTPWSVIHFNSKKFNLQKRDPHEAGTCETKTVGCADRRLYRKEAMPMDGLLHHLPPLRGEPGPRRALRLPGQRKRDRSSTTEAAPGKIIHLQFNSLTDGSQVVKELLSWLECRSTIDIGQRGKKRVEGWGKIG